MQYHGRNSQTYAILTTIIASVVPAMVGEHPRGEAGVEME